MLVGDTKPEVGGYLSPGIYRVITGQPKIGKSSVKGTPYVEHTVRDLDTGESCRMTQYITPKTIGMFAGWLQALGLTQDQRRTIDTDNVATMNAMLNKVIWVMVEDEEGDDGKLYGRIKRYAADGARPTWKDPAETSPRRSRDDHTPESEATYAWDKNPDAQTQDATPVSDTNPDPTPPPIDDDIPF